MAESSLTMPAVWSPLARRCSSPVPPYSRTRPALLRRSESSSKPYAVRPNEIRRAIPIRALILRMSSNPRVAVAALVRRRASVIVPRVTSDATSDRQPSDRLELQRRLTAYLERRLPLWVQALEADDVERPAAIMRLLRGEAVIRSIGRRKMQIRSGR